MEHLTGSSTWAKNSTWTALLAAVTRKRRKFFNFVEDEHAHIIKTNTRVSEATLIKKYQGIRFYDADEGEGEFYRIRSDRFSWKTGVVEAGCLMRQDGK
jgi:hypothetical protein